MADEKPQDEVVYTKTTEQAYLENLVETQGEADGSKVAKVEDPNPLGEGEYVGTDPIYQNYASETEKPLASEEGAQKDLLDSFKQNFQSTVNSDADEAADEEQAADEGDGDENQSPAEQPQGPFGSNQ